MVSEIIPRLNPIASWNHHRENVHQNPQTTTNPGSQSIGVERINNSSLESSPTLKPGTGSRGLHDTCVSCCSNQWHASTQAVFFFQTWRKQSAARGCRAAMLGGGAYVTAGQLKLKLISTFWVALASHVIAVTKAWRLYGFWDRYTNKFW